MGVSRDLPILGVYPILSQERVKLRTSNLARIITGSIRIHDKMEKMERGRIQGLPIFSGTPYYLRNSESYGFQIWPVHSEGQSKQIMPIKNFGENGAWVYPGTAGFFGYPLLSQAQGKVRISNLASTFRVSIQTKAH